MLDLETTAKVLRVHDYYTKHKKVLNMLTLTEALDHLNYILEIRKENAKKEHHDH